MTANENLKSHIAGLRRATPVAAAVSALILALSVRYVPTSFLFVVLSVSLGVCLFVLSWLYWRTGRNSFAVISMLVAIASTVVPERVLDGGSGILPVIQMMSIALVTFFAFFFIVAKSGKIEFD